MNQLIDLAANELQTAQQTYQHKAEVENADPILSKAYQFGYTKKQPHWDCDKTLALIEAHKDRKHDIIKHYNNGKRAGCAEAIQNYDLVCAQLELAEEHIKRMRNK